MLKTFYDRAQSDAKDMGLMHIIQNTGLIDSNQEFWDKVSAARAQYRMVEETRIGILGDNTARWLYHVLGAMGAGSTVACLNPDHEKEALIKAAADSGIRRLVCDGNCLRIGLQITAKVPGLSLVMMDSVAGLVEVPWDEGDTTEGEVLFFHEDGSIQVWQEDSPEPLKKEDQEIVDQAAKGKITLITRPLYQIDGFDAYARLVKTGCTIAIGTPDTAARDKSAVRPDYHVV